MELHFLLQCAYFTLFEEILQGRKLLTVSLNFYKSLVSASLQAEIEAFQPKADHASPEVG